SCAGTSMLFRPGLELPASPFTIISKVSSWNAAATPSSLIRDFSNSVVTTTFWPDPARCAREIKRVGSNVPSAMYASPSGPPVPSDSQVRILDGTEELACHHRFYDRGQLVLDPTHQQELLQEKRKARGSTPGGRLEQAVPESGALLEAAFARGESTHSQTAQLLKLLDTYGPAELREAIREALEHGTPRVSSVAFLLRKYQRS